MISILRGGCWERGKFFQRGWGGGGGGGAVFSQKIKKNLKYLMTKNFCLCHN